MVPLAFWQNILITTIASIRNNALEIIMSKIDNILANAAFKEHLSRINEAEIDRIYCLHGIEHLLDVARISYIINLEESLGFDKETIYAMALLHDIGRNLEYEKGVSHHEAGGDIALGVLRDAGFDEADCRLICQAIKNHKELKKGEDKKSLNYLLFKADKLSRNCFNCKAYDSCYWEESKKNKGITV